MHPAALLSTFFALFPLFKDSQTSLSLLLEFSITLFSRRDFFFIFRPAVEEEALNSIMKDLAALGRCYATAHKPKTRTLSYKQVHEKLSEQLLDNFFFLSQT